MQSQEEVFRIIKDWAGLGYAPTNLKKTERTADLLINWIAANDGDVMSFTGLNEAVKALGNQVLYSDKEMLEIATQEAIKKAAEGDAKMRQQYYDSIKPQQRLVETQKQKGVDKVKEKEIQNIRDEISTAINGHVVTAPNGQNYSKTEYEQGQLREVLAQHRVNTVANAKAALKAVLDKKSSFVRW